MFFAADFIFQTVQVFCAYQACPFYICKGSINLLLVLGFPDFLLTGENHIEFLKFIFSKQLILIQFLKSSHEGKIILGLFNLLVVLSNRKTILELVGALKVFKLTPAQI